MYSCNVNNRPENPFPDLAIDSIEQFPNPMTEGKAGKITIKITNNGGAPSIPSVIEIRDAAGKKLASKYLPQIDPEVFSKMTFNLLPAGASYKISIIIDPKEKTYEANRRNNLVFYNVQVESKQENKERNLEKAREYTAAARSNYTRRCLNSLRLLSLGRKDKIMDYEKAEPGDEVELVAVLFNGCDKPVHEIDVDWSAQPLDEQTIMPTMLGSTKIERILASEKVPIERMFIAREGRWKITLFVSSRLSDEKPFPFLMSFILIVTDNN